MKWFPMILLAATLAGCGSSKSSSTVHLRNSKLGRIAVDSKGRTLYLFAADKDGKSTCSGACAATWPPYKVGSKQVSYHGHPLYYYAGDGTTPGSTKGEGLNTFGAFWYVVDSSGRAVQPPSQGEMGGGGSTGYGY
ncbi:MAG: COG4315 family predicted lipoprotein [Gaiellaceae bacterium]